ncbi:molybdopterin-dependent oxidoreductase [Nocardia vermiculata]|uniref:Molybdopterin-dependent oxidoreductase n=1 Tax=Nocardia vermiculata TaxID=257274 RepID=A0A846XTB5_9NOCA|nr:molybdopterin-dependent oxidoreductase [Nocardia vermiculata]NKY50323.1 molybdopterin-dependent oxidoreductase [Nocardia vermiculata]
MGNGDRATPRGASSSSEQGLGTIPAFRSELQPGRDVVDPHEWAGGIPREAGIAPRVRVGRDKWFNVLWLLPVGFVVLIITVAAAKGLHNMPAVQNFMAEYPGSGLAPGHEHMPGIPAWLSWQHFFNLFLIMFILRSGLQILVDHPRLYFTRNCTPGKEWLRLRGPVPDDPFWTAKDDSVELPRQVGLPGIRHSIGLARWWHLGMDMLWLLNGVVFYVLLFTTGEWRRIVPTRWEVFPDAVTVLIRYLSLDWPTDNGWVAYNSLQLLTYFVTVFVAAPLALLTGLGMSPALSTRLGRISKPLNIQLARSLHFLVMMWFLLFIALHVTFVVTTGALRNLNHMFAGRDDDSWVGFGVFLIALVVVVLGWVAATPLTFRHPRLVQRVGYALVGPLQRLFEYTDAKPGTYSDADISPYLWHNGTYPDSDEYRRLYRSGFRDYRLRIFGLVRDPVDLSLDDLRALPYHEQTTQHFCIQGWSGVAKWGGVSMHSIMERVHPLPEAKWVVFYSLAEGSGGGTYYDAHAIEQMDHHLTMLAYTMNDDPLTYGHGAPLRLRNELQHGFKHVKWVAAIEFVDDFRQLGGGHGGYNEDHEFYGYRQTL